MKKILLFSAVLYVLVFAAGCGKDGEPEPSQGPVDKIAGVYTGEDSAAFINVIVHYDGSRTVINDEKNKKSRTVTVTRLSDSEFYIDLDSTVTALSNKIAFTGNSYSFAYGPSRTRTITFFPENDSISIIEDAVLANDPPEYMDGSYIDGRYVARYSRFCGKR